MAKRWRGEARAPDQYAAIHYHDDDVDDANWCTSFFWNVLDDLPSGVYAARLCVVVCECGSRGKIIVDESVPPTGLPSS